MTAEEGPANPFTPWRGGVPACGWHDQDDAMYELEELLEDLFVRGRGAEAHIAAPRGSGKTVLLKELGWDVRRKDGRVVRVEDLPGGSRTKIRERLRKEARRQPVMVLFDDAHRFPVREGDPPVPGSAQDIADAKGFGNGFHAARSLVRGGHPVLLVVAGVPYKWGGRPPGEIPRPERGTVGIENGTLDQFHIRQALEASKEQTGTGFDDAAAELLIREGGGHAPLFQALGHAAWKAVRAAGRDLVRSADVEAAARAVRGIKGRALAARLKIARRSGLLGKCLALADAMLASVPHAISPRPGLGTATDPSVDPADVGIKLDDSYGVLDRAAGPPGLRSDHAIEVMSRLGLFHVYPFGHPDIAPSYPTLCEYLLAHAGGDAAAREGG